MEPSVLSSPLQLLFPKKLLVLLMSAGGTPLAFSPISTPFLYKDIWPLLSTEKAI